MKTQKEQIRNYMKAGGKLTSMAALNFFKCFRLASRIDELKNEGMNIDKTMVKTATGKRVAEYFLVKEDTGWVNHFDF